MFTNGFCNTGTWGTPGNFSVWGSIGLILNLVFWIGLLVGLALLVIWATRRARVPAAAGPYATGQPAAGGQNTALEILQAQYARGEITREQYELRKKELG